LNCNLFYWPASVDAIFENSSLLIMVKRQNVEIDLRKRIEQFEERLERFDKEIETFKKKEVGVMHSAISVWFALN